MDLTIPLLRTVNLENIKLLSVGGGRGRFQNVVVEPARIEVTRSLKKKPWN
jgi:hypothetical protein